LKPYHNDYILQSNVGLIITISAPGFIKIKVKRSSCDTRGQDGCVIFQKSISRSEKNEKSFIRVPRV